MAALSQHALLGLKLGLLLVAVAMTRNGTAIILTWIVGLAVSLAVIFGHASMTRVLALTSPDFRSLLGRMSVVIASSRAQPRRSCTNTNSSPRGQRVRGAGRQRCFLRRMDDPLHRFDGACVAHHRTVRSRRC